MPLEFARDLVFAPAAVTHDKLDAAINRSTEFYIALDGIELAAKPHAIAHIDGLGDDFGT